MDKRNRYINHPVANMEMKQLCLFVINAPNGGASKDGLSHINHFIKSIFNSSYNCLDKVEIGIIQSCNNGYIITRDISLLSENEPAPTINATLATPQAVIATMNMAISMVYDRYEWYRATQQKFHTPAIYTISTSEFCNELDSDSYKALEARIRCDLFFKRYKIIGLGCNLEQNKSFTLHKKWFRSVLPLEGTTFDYVYPYPASGSSIPTLSKPVWRRFNKPNSAVSEVVTDTEELKYLYVFVVDGTAYNDGKITDSFNKLLSDFYTFIQSSEEDIIEKIELVVIQACARPQILRFPATLSKDETAPKIVATDCIPSIIASMNNAIDIIEQRKEWYKQRGQKYYRPAIVYCSSNSCINADTYCDDEKEYDLLMHRVEDANRNKRFAMVSIVSNPYLRVGHEADEIFGTKANIDESEFIIATLLNPPFNYEYDSKDRLNLRDLSEN